MQPLGSQPGGGGGGGGEVHGVSVIVNFLDIYRAVTPTVPPTPNTSVSTTEQDTQRGFLHIRKVIDSYFMTYWRYFTSDRRLVRMADWGRYNLHQLEHISRLDLYLVTAGEDLDGLTADDIYLQMISPTCERSEATESQ